MQKKCLAGIVGAFCFFVPLSIVTILSMPNELEIARRPLIYRDVNGDGVKDKIFYRIKEEKTVFGTWNKLEEIVEYGIDINGKRVYLTPIEFSYYNKTKH
jgi:hypothetical protein